MSVSSREGDARRPATDSDLPVTRVGAGAEPEGGTRSSARPRTTPRGRFAAFWARHRTLFWTVHSLWALATGVVVIYLARERYGFVPWVVAFLVLTWASTLFFGRQIAGPGEDDADGEGGDASPGLGQEATSYVTRTMYQETLFFLLPFYWYSTVVWSPNVLFPVLLGSLAVLSCVDLVFDRWLRRSPLFGLVFFAAVAFAAVNLLLPILFPVDPVIGTPIAAAVAVASALPLALTGALLSKGGGLRVAVVAVVLLGLPIAFPRLVPPVPLRLQNAVFASDLDRDTLVPADTLASGVPVEDLDGALFVLVEVFSPSIVSTEVSLEWRLNGEPVRTSRDIQIVAHDLGFRVWDGWRPEGGLPAGSYEIVLRTPGQRVFGRALLELTAS